MYTPKFGGKQADKDQIRLIPNFSVSIAHRRFDCPPQFL